MEERQKSFFHPKSESYSNAYCRGNSKIANSNLTKRDPTRWLILDYAYTFDLDSIRHGGIVDYSAIFFLCCGQLPSSYVLTGKCLTSTRTVNVITCSLCVIRYYSSVRFHSWTIIRWIKQSVNATKMRQSAKAKCHAIF